LGMQDFDIIIIKVFLGLVTHLFVKVPRPGGSEVTFSVFDHIAQV